MIDAMRKPLSSMLAAALLTVSACGGANRAPVEERNTAAGGAAGSAGGSMGPTSAGAEVSEGDWTAKVRPLGDSAASVSRELPGSDPPPRPSASAPQPSASAPRRTVAPPPARQTGGGAQTVNPAVVSLLNTASAQSRAGDYPRAAATLERAIAIEPDNAWLWHRLAETRLHEGRLEQAASLASKSSSLGSADRRLQADNWNLIAEVRRRQGDTAGAAAAAAEARTLGN